MSSQDSYVLEIVIGIISGLFTIPVVTLMVWLYKRHQTRHIRSFWGPFLGKKLTIVMTEYPAIGDELSAKTARQAGGGYLVSRGNALAMSNLSDFILDNVTSREHLVVCGDKTGVPNYDHLIVIGSPANNRFSQAVFASLDERFEIPYTVMYDEHNATIGFESKNGDHLEYIPKIENGEGVDYAFVLRAKYKSYPSRYVIMLAGAYMFGAQAASIAVTNREIVGQVAKLSENAENVLFLIKTRVLNNNPGEPELEVGATVFVHSLTPKTNQQP